MDATLDISPPELEEILQFFLKDVRQENILKGNPYMNDVRTFIKLWVAAYFADADDNHYSRYD